MNIENINIGENPSSELKFFVRHFTGLGVVEEPYVDREIVFASDNYEECKSVSDQLFKQKNPDAQDSWTYHNYGVYLNSNSHEGKLESARRKEIMDATWKYIEEHPEEFDRTEVGGYTFITAKGAFDEMNKYWKPATLTPCTEEEIETIRKKLAGEI